jgi:16S rRNA (uracil1498-N3)-methyltransferase
VRSNALAGSAGPHVFVDSLTELCVRSEDLAHLSKSLRMRSGDVLTASDGQGSWRHVRFGATDRLDATGEIITVAEPARETCVAFSLVKGQKPELVIQKLTELGLGRIVVLDADRSVVKWDDEKIDRAQHRWERIVREAAMQSHRVRLPKVEALIPALEWIGQAEVSIAHFGGGAVGSSDTSIAIGPEGGWSPEETAAAARTVSLGSTVLRAETAAIAAGTLLTAV